MPRLHDTRRLPPVADLIAALAAEDRMLSELRVALAAQRAGVAADDATRVDSATHAVSRAVLTLEEARRRRETIIEAMMGPGQGIAELEAAHGPIPKLTTMREELRRNAALTVRDLAITQTVLKGAMRAGEACLQAMLGAGAAASTGYGPGDQAGDGLRPGVLLNRSA